MRRRSVSVDVSALTALREQAARANTASTVDPKRASKKASKPKKVRREIKAVGKSAKDTKLLEAAFKGNIKDLQALLKKGAFVHAKDEATGETPLHLAAQGGQDAAIEILLTSGADANILSYKGETALHFAAALGYADIIRVLVRVAGPKLQFDVVDKQSSTPLQLAIGAQHFDTFKLLLEKGADSNKADDRGETPMHYCARHDFWKGVPLVQEWGGDVDRRNVTGNTPLHIASQLGHVPSVVALLAAGANPDVKNNQGQIPAQLARQSGFMDIVGMLNANAPAPRGRRGIRSMYGGQTPEQTTAGPPTASSQISTSMTSSDLQSQCGSGGAPIPRPIARGPPPKPNRKRGATTAPAPGSPPIPLNLPRVPPPPVGAPPPPLHGSQTARRATEIPTSYDDTRPRAGSNTVLDLNLELPPPPVPPRDEDVIAMDNIALPPPPPASLSASDGGSIAMPTHLPPPPSFASNNAKHIPTLPSTLPPPLAATSKPPHPKPRPCPPGPKGPLPLARTTPPSARETKEDQISPRIRAQSMSSLTSRTRNAPAAPPAAGRGPLPRPIKPPAMAVGTSLLPPPPSLSAPVKRFSGGEVAGRSISAADRTDSQSPDKRASGALKEKHMKNYRTKKEPKLTKSISGKYPMEGRENKEQESIPRRPASTIGAAPDHPNKPPPPGIQAPLIPPPL